MSMRNKIPRRYKMKRLYEYRVYGHKYSLVKALFEVLDYIDLVCHAICHKPIIHNVIFDGGITLAKDNRNAFILGCTFKD